MVRVDSQNVRYVNDIPPGEEWAQGFQESIGWCEGPPPDSCFQQDGGGVTCPSCPCFEKATPGLSGALHYLDTMWSQAMMHSMEPTGLRYLSSLLGFLQHSWQMLSRPVSERLSLSWKVAGSEMVNSSWKRQTFSIGRVEGFQVSCQSAGDAEVSVCFTSSATTMVQRSFLFNARILLNGQVQDMHGVVGWDFEPECMKFIAEPDLHINFELAAVLSSPLTWLLYHFAFSKTTCSATKKTSTLLGEWSGW